MWLWICCLSKCVPITASKPSKQRSTSSMPILCANSGATSPRFEALYDVKALNAFCLAPTFLGGAHFRPCAFHAFQVKRSLEQAGRPFFGG